MFGTCVAVGNRCIVKVVWIMIEVHIPYDHTGEKNLGRVYNEIMENARYDNVLFVDHDVYLKLNPEWYKMCCEVIKWWEGQDCQPWGWVTCWTNRIGCRWQRMRGVELSGDIDEHWDIARKIWEKWGKRITVIDPKANFESGLLTDYPSGYFLLTNKKAWKAVGGFEEGMLEKTDTKYGIALAKQDFRFIRMDGLYVYHAYDREWSWS